MASNSTPKKPATHGPPLLKKRPEPRIKAEERKRLVAKYVSISGMTNLVDIARQIRKFTGKPVRPETVKKDLDEIFQNAESFQRDLALKTWMAKVHEMYAETTEEIKEIQGVKNKMLAADPKLPQALLKLLEQMEDPKEQEAIISYLKKLRGSADAQKMLGKLSYATQVLNEKRAFLISLVTSVPLYNQTASLAKFYESHHKE